MVVDQARKGQFRFRNINELDQPRESSSLEKIEYGHNETGLRQRATTFQDTETEKSSADFR